MIDNILLVIYLLVPVGFILYLYVGSDVYHFYRKSYWKQFTVQKFIYTLITFATIQWILRSIFK